MSDEPACPFEIRARAPPLMESACQPAGPGRVRQVIQAFEAVTMAGGPRSEMKENVIPPSFNEYGSNKELFGMGGRKRSWEEIMGEGEENPTLKKQFVEEVDEDTLKSVEEASREWPQTDK
ncbi:unnamed protein product [Linum trigynum]|uniref:Uncharacterized protein n=1 Tax=Linum trigynum TaxID=586398 RepID=A0AAV2CKG1_9ROSI